MTTDTSNDHLPITITLANLSSAQAKRDKTKYNRKWKKIPLMFYSLEFPTLAFHAHLSNIQASADAGSGIRLCIGRNKKKLIYC